MLEEYIEKMQSENEQKLSSFQREMEEIVTDLNNTQSLMERLQYEKKLDTNIFSPRKVDAKADDKINECKVKIKGLKQRMEYVSQMVEESINKRNELVRLSEELRERGTKENIINESKEKNQNEVGKEKSNTDTENHQKELIVFLNEVYKHNEIALALLNSNKNRCKIEIRNSMSMIREYVKKVENGEL